MSSLASETPLLLCPLGCYWACEHRPPVTSATAAGAGRPQPVSDDEGRPLRRCRECGGSFYSASAHAAGHEGLRRLGLLVPRYPIRWPAVRPRR